MKKIKLVVIAVMMIMVLSMGKEVYAAATASSKNIPVTYDNTLVPDPDNPGAATWGVSLPGKIMFSDNQKTVSDLDVTLKGMSGYDIPDGLSVDVSVKSLNGFNVKHNDTLISYTLNYDGTLLTGKGDNVLTELTKDSFTRKGTATLTGTTTVQGSYSDTLTYTVQKKTVLIP
ncbi:hypothetical protein ABZ40_13410 [Listeria monocytogenes]|uniref:hypothetical protein n=1 Tax=Listeria monocytogenes TaxID=1639 RepID=UPI0010D23C09|nr:hypothetical protein [Listeria monocytogenes]EAD7292670.1 hypothetical protein [Listeria monocytogenes]TYU82141.1 hypothetical protein FZX01_16140 [Listeria monocytogenes]